MKLQASSCDAATSTVKKDAVYILLRVAVDPLLRYSFKRSKKLCCWIVTKLHATYLVVLSVDSVVYGNLCVCERERESECVCVCVRVRAYKNLNVFTVMKLEFGFSM